jgi:hypothetical protein
MIETVIAWPTAVVETPAIVDPAEAQLVDEVGNLWLVHSQAQTSLSKSRDELKAPPDRFITATTCALGPIGQAWQGWCLVELPRIAGYSAIERRQARACVQEDHLCGPGQLHQ